MPIILPWYAACAVLAKTSLLGLGVLTIVLACLAMIAHRLFADSLPLGSQLRLKTIFKTAIWLQLAVYLLLVVKLIVAVAMDSSWQDIPTFILSHLVMHHVMSALIATVLIVLTIRLYNHRHAEQQAPQIP